MAQELVSKKVTDIAEKKKEKAILKISFFSSSSSSSSYSCYCYGYC